MILVAGASGCLGSRVAHLLLDRGEPVRAGSRSPGQRLADLAARGAETVQLDLRDRAAVERAVSGVDRVVAAAQAFFPPARANNIDTVDDAGNRNLIAAARKANVSHFVFVSNSLASPASPAKFSRIKHAVEECLKASGLTYTIIRPAAFMEFHALLLMGEGLLHKGKVQIFGRGQTRLHWVSADDVAHCVAGVFSDPARRNTLVRISGRDRLSRVEVLERLELALGRTAQRSHVPAGVMRVMQALTRPINPGLSYLIEGALAEESHPEPADAQEWDWTGPTTLDEVIRAWAGQRGGLAAAHGA